jgi:hypothetical protein
VTKNAGHCPHIDAPDEFNAVLSRLSEGGADCPDQNRPGLRSETIEDHSMCAAVH